MPKDNQKPTYFPTDKMFGPNHTEYRLISATWHPSKTRNEPGYWECRYESISPWNIVVIKY